MQPFPNRLCGRARDLADLLIAELFFVEESQAESGLLRQRLGKPVETVGKAFYLHCLRKYLQGSSRRAGTAQELPARVGGDLPQPVGELLRVSQLIELQPGADKGLLGKVLGVVAIVDPAAALADDGVSIALYQLAERLQFLRCGCTSSISDSLFALISGIKMRRRAE